ncbi:putative NAD(P)H dehydrogenase (quinone) FQR1-like 1 [Capsicum annuum]|nr:putative NAD(P)H dehydrogenase (quinone) FQR1-like 1 [Capsicum annuum]
MGGPAKGDAPIITPNDLNEADGFLFELLTRFGMMDAQFKASLDATGGLWRTQQLADISAALLVGSLQVFTCL